MTAPLAASSPEAGATPWGEARLPSRARWRALLWLLLHPPQGARVAATPAGLLLVVVALGIGAAAYNTSNNILFITFSLLLSCLVLSGVLSWLNLRGVHWRLHVSAPWRAGQVQSVALELRNAKRILPTYGLWFDLVAGPASERRHLGCRLDPGEHVRLDWPVRPERRGPIDIELRAAGSLYPFGFLRKSIPAPLRKRALVWPATVPYRRDARSPAWRSARGRGDIRRAGHGGDLFALRPYAPGDSPRLVHWKASARLRRLLIRQFSDEGAEGILLRLDSDATLWPRPEQFELAVGLAASLAEDLFKLERLLGTQFAPEPPRPSRRRRDVEDWLDRLALAQPTPAANARARLPSHVRMLELKPDGPRGVVAYLDGRPAATA